MGKLKTTLGYVKKMLTQNMHFKILSLMISIIIWLIVVWSIDPDITKLIRDVPIQIDISETSIIGKMGLNIIDGNNLSANVYIKGKRNVVGTMGKDDIIATVSTGDVTGAGIYTLEVVAAIKNQMYKDVEFSVIKPSTIDVKLDKLISKSIPIEVIGDKVTVPEGYILDKSIISINEVIATGPEMEINDVEKCIVDCKLNNGISSTVKVAGEAKLVDKNDFEIDMKYIKIDNDIINVTVPVLKKKKLPIKIDFINQPNGFPIEQLVYSIEPSQIELAGPEDEINSKESINATYIDLKKLGIQNEAQYDILLPSNFVNIENIEKVNVSFDMHNFESKKFSGVVIKVPYTFAEYDIIVNSKRLNNIEVVGQGNIIETLTSGDIVAEIEMNDKDLMAGQMTLPVKISIPNKGLVWPIGEYKAVVTITDK